jgi:hypothetical protein
MDGKQTVVRNGIGLGGFIFLIFLTLKILVISNVLPAANFAWLTWFWVFFPLWISFAIGFTILIIFFIIALLIAATN